MIPAVDGECEVAPDLTSFVATTTIEGRRMPSLTAADSACAGVSVPVNTIEERTRTLVRTNRSRRGRFAWFITLRERASHF